MAEWCHECGVAGPNGKPTSGARVDASGSHGGAGISDGSNHGYNDTPGALVQFGSGYLNWAAWRYKTSLIPSGRGWTGEHTWGVGLDSRKQTLLVETEDSYKLNSGWLDTTDLTPGHYILTLEPSGMPLVLDPDVDLSNIQPGGIVIDAESVSDPVSIEFDVEE